MQELQTSAVQRLHSSKLVQRFRQRFVPKRDGVSFVFVFLFMCIRLNILCDDNGNVGYKVIHVSSILIVYHICHGYSKDEHGRIPPLVLGAVGGSVCGNLSAEPNHGTKFGSRGGVRVSWVIILTSRVFFTI